MNYYIKPITEIDSLIMPEFNVMAGSVPYAQPDDMAKFDGLPVRGDFHQDPEFNSNKFTSDGYW